MGQSFGCCDSFHHLLSLLQVIAQLEVCDDGANLVVPQEVLDADVKPTSQSMESTHAHLHATGWVLGVHSQQLDVLLTITGRVLHCQQTHGGTIADVQPQAVQLPGCLLLVSCTGLGWHCGRHIIAGSHAGCGGHQIFPWCFGVGSGVNKLRAVRGVQLQYDANLLRSSYN